MCLYINCEVHQETGKFLMEIASAILNLKLNFFYLCYQQNKHPRKKSE